MNPQTLIFMGPQGCGKGTQVELLKKYLKEKDPSTPHFHFATGDGFRALLARENFTSKRVKELMHEGKLQPLFLAVWLWGNAFVEGLKDNEHMFIDGYPRILDEAKVLDTAFEFYKRDNVIVFFLNVSDEVAKKRMQGRGRADDHDEAIEARLQQYKELTVPVLEYFRSHPRYTVVDVDGEQPVEGVQQSIILGLPKI